MESFLLTVILKIDFVFEESFLRCIFIDLVLVLFINGRF